MSVICFSWWWDLGQCVGDMVVNRGVMGMLAVRYLFFLVV